MSLDYLSNNIFLSEEDFNYKKLNYKFIYISFSFIFGFSTISELAELYFLKDVLKLDPAYMSLFISLIRIPFFIKPIFGFITDLYQINGYRRKPYIIIFGLLSGFCWIYLYFFYNYLSLIHLFLILMIISCSMSFCSVIGEALVIELSMMETADKEEDLSKNYVSYFFFFKHIGGLLAALFKGFIIEYLGIRNVFLIKSIVPFAITICYY